MLILTPKYGSLIEDILKNKKEQKKDSLIKHRNDVIYLTHCKTIEEAYLTFLDNKDKYFIGYKPKDAKEIKVFVRSLGEIDMLDVGWIDVRELNSLEDCFDSCKAKHIIGLDKWDVNNVETMAFMFWGCENLESIDDISGWDVNNVISMYCMFNECKKLKTVGNIEQWNVPYKVNTENMFFNSAINQLPSWYT